MNANQIKQRLIEASLTDNIPATPAFRYPQEERRRMPRWVAYGAAACVAAAVALPLLLHRPTPELTADTFLATDDPAIELECAFAMVNEHFSASDNLIDIIL